MSAHEQSTDQNRARVPSRDGVRTELITDPSEVRAVAEQVAASGQLLLDIEFVSESRYIPELSLVQVGWGSADAPNVVAIDFLSVGEPGIRPLLELVQRPDIETVAHAARQDLGLLCTRYQVRARNLIDTQVAALFCGLGEQIGYASLVRQVCGVKLDKSSQFTDWLARPVSADKLRYALDDVLYLPRVWTELSARLRAAGRESWAREESQRMADAVQPPPAPDVAYLEVKGWRGLRGSQLGSLQALADWRQRLAMDENLPLSWVLPDRAMIDLCRNRARDARGLRRVRGIGDGTVRKHGEAILQKLTDGARTEPPAPVDTGKPTLSARANVWAAIVTKIAQARALDHQLPHHLVVGKSDAERLAAWFDERDESAESEPDIPLLTGWRRQIAGQVALGWLRGEFALTADAGPGGLNLRPCAKPNE